MRIVFETRNMKVKHREQNGDLNDNIGNLAAAGLQYPTALHEIAGVLMKKCGYNICCPNI
jgi:hypothetical protein